MKEKVLDFMASWVVFTALFLSLFYSWGAYEHTKNIEEKLRIRDSIFLKKQHHQEHQDSITYYYLDKWIDKLHKP